MEHVGNHGEGNMVLRRMLPFLVWYVMLCKKVDIAT